VGPDIARKRKGPEQTSEICLTSCGTNGSESQSSRDWAYAFPNIGQLGDNTNQRIHDAMLKAEATQQQDTIHERVCKVKKIRSQQAKKNNRNNLHQ
jgi:hypothetical protein